MPSLRDVELESDKQEQQARTEPVVVEDISGDENDGGSGRGTPMPLTVGIVHTTDAWEEHH